MSPGQRTFAARKARHAPPELTSPAAPVDPPAEVPDLLAVEKASRQAAEGPGERPTRLYGLSPEVLYAPPPEPPAGPLEAVIGFYLKVAPPGYQCRRLDMKLSADQAEVLNTLAQGLNRANVRLAGGKHVLGGADACRWLLELIAPLVPEPAPEPETKGPTDEGDQPQADDDQALQGQPPPS